MSYEVKMLDGVGKRRFRSYPEYRDSGMEWFGATPQKWGLKPLKRIFRVVNGATPRSNESSYWDGEIIWVTPEDLGELATPVLNASRRYITQEGYQSCGTSFVPAGSLVLSTRAPIGHLAIAGVDLCTNQGCRSLMFLNKGNSRFYYYQLVAARSELESQGRGSTFKELGKTQLKVIPLIVPTKAE